MKPFEVLDSISQLEGVLKDARLSAKALGVFVQLSSLPPEGRTLKKLGTVILDGRESIQSAIHELEELGYLDRVARQKDGGGREYRYFFNVHGFGQ